MAKATFYKHFPAKDDLVLAYLDQVDRIWSGQLRAAAEAAGPAPARPARRHVRRPELSACRREGYRGCAFINAAAENEAGHRRARPHRRPQDTSCAPGCADLARRRRRRRPRPPRPPLTLLLDGGLASGSSTDCPDAARGRQGRGTGPGDARCTQTMTDRN